MANFGKNKYVALAVIDKICGALHCQPGDIMEWVEDENEAEKKTNWGSNCLTSSETKNHVGGYNHDRRKNKIWF